MNKSTFLAFLEEPVLPRKRLEIPPAINFGLEIEIEGVDFDTVKRLIRNTTKNTWHVEGEISLSEKGAEVVSPVLQNREATWELVKKVSKTLHFLKPTFEDCSFQVNYDMDILKDEKSFLNFIKLFMAYEDVLYFFSRGKDENIRKSAGLYAGPIAKKVYQNGNIERDLSLSDFAFLKQNKFFALSLKEKEIIEFRTPNGTDDFVLWQNYIMTFYSMLAYANHATYDIQKINQYLKTPFSFYANLEIESLFAKIIEFAAMIFPSELDQLYFLRQCTLGNREEIKTYLKKVS